jgi:hypothetical protein
MKAFTSTQKRLMTQLGYSSAEQMELFFEGYEESSFECRANDIPVQSFSNYLNKQLIWKGLIKREVA